MSLYVPSAITNDILNIARAPYLGGEWALYLTRKPAQLVGEIELSAAGAGTLDLNEGYTLEEGDLQMVCLSPLISDVECVVTLNTKDNYSVPNTMDGVATFSPPARASNQSYDFSRGYAVDIVPATEGYQFTEVTSLKSVAGGDKLVKFGIYRLPALTDFSLVGCLTDKSFSTPSRTPKGIDCGLETDAYIKRGKVQEHTLSVTGKLFGFGEGLARFDGFMCTAMLVGVKDAQVTGDRLVFADWTAALKPSLPDGDGDATISAEGKYREFMAFVAP